MTPKYPLPIPPSEEGRCERHISQWVKAGTFNYDGVRFVRWHCSASRTERCTEYTPEPEREGDHD